MRVKAGHRSHRGPGGIIAHIMNCVVGQRRHDDGDLGFFAALPTAFVFDVQALAAYVLVGQIGGIGGVEGGLDVIGGGLSFIPERSRIPASDVLGNYGPLGSYRCLAFHFDDLSHTGPEGGDLAGG